MYLPDQRRPIDLKSLQKHTLYEVRVAWNASNPIHTAFLFMGFHHGSYCTIYTNSYDNPVDATKAYWVEIVREVASLEDKEEADETNGVI